jgi:hypothetical protein
MSDPVRDTRQAVDAARHELEGWLQLESWTGGMPVSSAYRKQMSAPVLSAFEAAVRADERRETLALGDDATEARP